MSAQRKQLKIFLRSKPPTGAIMTEAPSFTSGCVADPGNEMNYTAISDDEIVRMALLITARRMSQAGSVLTSPQHTRDYLRLRLGELQHEVFGVIWLNNRNKVIAMEELFTGTVDGATVHPREVCKAGLRHNAAACILYHNHPSSVSEPSTADQLITARIKDSLAAVDIRVLDHLVIAASEVTSMAERGMV
jgi:DNA repair protein RadC